MKEEYIDFENGKTYEINPKETFIRIACCECGLVHDLTLEIAGDKVRFVLETNEEETKKVRDEYGISFEA